MADPVDPTKITQGLFSDMQFVYKQSEPQRDKGYSQDKTWGWEESCVTKDVANAHIVKSWYRICCTVVNTRQMNRWIIIFKMF